MGKLIVIEGLDGSGKQTQSIKLMERLKNEGYNCRRIAFPNYDSDSSIFVRKYLSGEFGTNIKDISPYAIVTFYACDRYISYINEWKDFYEKEDSIIVADRYTQSSMLYQSMMIDNKYDILNFCDWVLNYENRLGIPKADKVLFLKLHPDISNRLMKERGDNKHGSRDIHEEQPEIMKLLYERHELISELYNWDIIDCDDGNGIKSVDEISDEIYSKVIEEIK